MIHDTDTPRGFTTDPMDYSYWVEGKIITEGEVRLVENTLGLVGEAGEVAEKIKKYLRDNTKVDKQDIHVMNKRALDRMLPGLLEKFNV